MSSQPTEAQHAYDAIQELDDKGVDNVYRNMQEWSPLAVASAAAAVAIGAEVKYDYIGDGDGPPFLNGWRNFGEDWSPARWRHLVNVVHLSGLVAHDGPLTEASVLFVLPEGARPDSSLVFAVASDNSVSRVDVHPDGSVVWFVYLAGSDGADRYLSLSQIRFSIGG